jgi:hypothetical protein
MLESFRETRFDISEILVWTGTSDSLGIAKETKKSLCGREICVNLQGCQIGTQRRSVSH